MKIQLTSSFPYQADGYIDALRHIVENWKDYRNEIKIEFTPTPNGQKAVKVSGKFHIISEDGTVTYLPHFYVVREDLKRIPSLDRLAFRFGLRDIILETSRHYQDLSNKEKWFEGLADDVRAKKVAYIGDNDPLSHNNTILNYAVFTAVSDVRFHKREFEKSVRQFVGYNL